MTEKRGKHSHRCKICRNGVYCYKSQCGLPQRLDACDECRRTGRYSAPVRAVEPLTPGQRAYETDVRATPRYQDGGIRKTWAQLMDLERSTWEKNPTPRSVPPLKGWLAGLPTETRETVYALMRDIDQIAERANKEHMKLRPRYGEIAVGGAHMDPFFKCEGLRGLLRALRDGATPGEAWEAGNRAANFAIGKWNASREWQVRRALDSERSGLQYQASRLQLAVQKEVTV